MCYKELWKEELILFLQPSTGKLRTPTFGELCHDFQRLDWFLELYLFIEVFPWTSCQNHKERLIMIISQERRTCGADVAQHLCNRSWRVETLHVRFGSRWRCCCTGPCCKRTWRCGHSGIPGPCRLCLRSASPLYRKLQQKNATAHPWACTYIPFECNPVVLVCISSPRTSALSRPSITT